MHNNTNRVHIYLKIAVAMVLDTIWFVSINAYFASCLK